MRTDRCKPIPLWNPISVRWLARVWPLTPEMVDRLVTDPGMQYVWREIEHRSIPNEQSRLRDVPSECRLEHWGIYKSRIGLRDELCGAFFVAALDELRSEYKSTASVNAKASRAWLEAALCCETALTAHPFGSLMLNNTELKNSLEMVADHFRWVGGLIEQRGNPRVFDRHSGTRGDALLRAHVRAIASRAKALFDTPLPGTVARIVSVAHGLKEPILIKTAENWCNELPV